MMVDKRVLRAAYLYVLVVLLCSTAGATAGPAKFFNPGPNLYKQVSDSPFYGSPGFTVEDFEDGFLNILGVSEVSGNGRVIAPSSITDSVDGDDGIIDGFGRGGHSMADGGANWLSFVFDATAIGSAPTQAGIVWTDGGNGNIIVEFEAFDLDGNSLGEIVDSFFDGNFFGETDDDRFYGVEYALGISRIDIRYSGGIFEVDHLQYGMGPIAVPLPLPVLLGLAGLVGVGALRRRWMV